jgi:hypothetical protein
VVLPSTAQDERKHRADMPFSLKRRLPSKGGCNKLKIIAGGLQPRSAGMMLALAVRTVQAGNMPALRAPGLPVRKDE